MSVTQYNDKTRYTTKRLIAIETEYESAVIIDCSNNVKLVNTSFEVQTKFIFGNSLQQLYIFSFDQDNEFVVIGNKKVENTTFVLATCELIMPANRLAICIDTSDDKCYSFSLKDVHGVETTYSKTGMMTVRYHH